MRSAIVIVSLLVLVSGALAANPDAPTGGVVLDFWGGFDTWDTKITAKRGIGAALGISEIGFADLKADGVGANFGGKLGVPASERTTFFLSGGYFGSKSDWKYSPTETIQNGWGATLRVRFYIGGKE